MKTMTCNQLGGACDKKFTGNTFEELAEQSKAHAMEMFQTSDADHLQALGKMQQLMQTPNGMQEWFEEKKKEFENLTED